jgi:hypothetical protein
MLPSRWSLRPARSHSERQNKWPIKTQEVRPLINAGWVQAPHILVQYLGAIELAVPVKLPVPQRSQVRIEHNVVLGVGRDVCYSCNFEL